MALIVAGGLAGGLIVTSCSSNSAKTCGIGRTCSGDGGPSDGAPVDGPRPDGAPAGGVPTGPCGKVQPCGGDIVGNWMFTETCQSIANAAAVAANFATMAEGSWCPGQTLVGQSPAVSGSYTFAADGTYALSLVFGGTIDINLPASCLAGLTCDDTTAGLQAQIDNGSYPMPHVTSISCAGSSSCVCRATIDAPHPENGTYTVSGNVLNLAPTGRPARNQSYCIAGGTLHVLDTSMPLMGQTDVDTDYVAIKQPDQTAIEP
jgi:hypothetical protein